MKRILKKIRKKIYLTPKEKKELIASKRIEPWNKINGDKTLRLNYDNLDENSIIFDLGGYEGQFASDIFSKYQSNIFVFEPIPSFYQKIEKRFIKNKKILSFNYGLSNNDKEVNFFLSNDGTGEFASEGKKEKVILRSMELFLQDNKINSIDLLKVNIEGGEYDLFLDMPKTLLHKIKHIQIQFHDLFPNSEAKMKEIHNKFFENHSIEWQYPFIWESWKRKDLY